jgi:CheY-like chemotaxis protein
MTAFRILHVDDEADMRELVELSLGLDPAFTVRSCASGAEAIAIAAEWKPDLILCDVVMPGMDGPATLARLRETPETADCPVVFMTARAQPDDLARLNLLCAAGVIVKPFDPMMLAECVRRELRCAKLAALRAGFLVRLRTDAAALTQCRTALQSEPTAQLLAEIQACAHALAGAAGIFGFTDVGISASALEYSVIDTTPGRAARAKVEDDLDALIACIERE